MKQTLIHLTESNTEDARARAFFLLEMLRKAKDLAAMKCYDTKPFDVNSKQKRFDLFSVMRYVKYSTVKPNEL